MMENTGDPKTSRCTALEVLGCPLHLNLWYDTIHSITFQVLSGAARSLCLGQPDSRTILTETYRAGRATGCFAIWT